MTLKRSWQIQGYRVVEVAETWYVYAGKGGVLYQGDSLGVVEFLRARGIELGGSL